MKLMECIKAALVIAAILLATSCSTPGPGAKAARFTEEESADFVARYYSDGTSYVLRPALKEGSYQTICDRAHVLALAGQQPRRDLAVVVLIHYPGPSTEGPVKLAWVNDLKGLGYQRVVFLRGGNRMQVNGLPVLESPSASAIVAGK